MLQTKTEEQHEVNGTILHSKLFINVSDIMFSIENGTILAYAKKGYILNKTEQVETIDPTDPDEVVITEVTTQHRVNVKISKLTYTETDIKGLFDLNGISFNSDNANLLLTSLKSASDLIAMYVVQNDPNNNFGLSIDKWEIV